MPGQRSPDIVQINLRLPKDLWARLKREAKRADRSLNQEMIERLEHTFERVEADALLEQAHAQIAQAKELYVKALEENYETKMLRTKIYSPTISVTPPKGGKK
jgi:hypothetical protein